jgi:hypothetical protein
LPRLLHNDTQPGEPRARPIPALQILPDREYEYSLDRGVVKSRVSVDLHGDDNHPARIHHQDGSPVPPVVSAEPHQRERKSWRNFSRSSGVIRSQRSALGRRHLE